LTDCLTRDNGRSGFTIQRRLEWVYIANCHHKDNKDQSIDFEPTGVTDPTNRPRFIFIIGGGIEHSTAAHALTLSNSDYVTIANYYVYGCVQGVNVWNLTMDNVRIFSNMPTEGKTPRKGIEFIRDTRNVALNNVHLEQRDDAIAVSFAYNNGAAPDGVTWRGGSLVQPFNRAGANMTSADNVSFGGVDFLGPGTSIAVHSQQINGDIERLRVEGCNFANWEKGTRINSGNTGRVYRTANDYHNVAIPFEIAQNTTVGAVIEGLNGE
jgi:hypothetical protein